MKTNRSEDKSIESAYDLSSQRFYHGTKASLKLKTMKEHIERLKQLGIEAIED